MSEHKPFLLIVEDNALLSQQLRRWLCSDFNVFQSPTLDNALQIIANQNFEIVLLDRILPDGDGLEILPFLELDHPHTRICILSSRDSLTEKALGLEKGADVYITKPSSAREIYAQIRALLKRGKVFQGRLLRREDIFLDPIHRTISRDGIQLNLTQRETHLLAAFLQAPSGFLSKSQLREVLWEIGSEANQSVLHVNIQRIRKRLEALRVTISTHYGTGYQLNLE